jgi:hypothetical protein
LYLESGEVAMDIDQHASGRKPRSWSPAKTMAGLRCFLSTKSRPDDTNRERYDHLLVFAKALYDRAMAMPATAPCSLSYAGWSEETANRAYHHPQDSNSWLMELTTAVARNAYSDEGFHLYPMPVYHITRPEHGGLGEVAFHRLSQSYYSNGGGFSVHRAGLNTTTARQPDAEAGILLRREDG